MEEKKNYFQKFSRPILFVGAILLAVGAYFYTHMQTNLFPEVLFPRVAIIADAGQLPIDRMMLTVTKPLESAVKKVRGVTIVKSSTSRGSVTIDVYFDWGLDTYAQKTQIESRVNEIKNFLPAGINMSIEAMNQSLFPVYGYTLSSKTHGQVALKDQAYLTLRPIFSRVKGIANVVTRGGRSKEFVIIPDPVKMSTLGISPAAVKAAFANNNFVLSNGNLADFNRLYLTLTDTRVLDVDALSNLTIRNDGSRLIKLRDFATVDLQEQQEFVVVNANGKNAVQIDLVKQPGVNLIDFAKDAAAKAEEVRKALPDDYELTPYYDQSAFVGDSIHSVIKTIYEGLILAIIVMIFFLKSWRSSLAVMLSIPVTLGFTITVLYLAGITINIMSLGAIAASVGLIIDDAIVIIEQIHREHEEFPQKHIYDVVIDAIKALFPAMVGSSLATIVIFFPFRLMSGLAGSFFKELSDTMQITLVCSFLVTWLLLPVLHILVGYRPHKGSGHKHNDFTTNKLSWLTWTFKKPVFALLFVAILGVSAYFVSGKLETGFLPNLDEGTIVLDYFSPSGTSIEETDRLCKQMEKIVTAQPEVETYSRRTGVKMAFRTTQPNFGDYSIQLKKDRKKTTDEVISDLRDKISAHVPVMHISFGQRISDLLGDLMSTPAPIEIKIFGDDYAKLQDYDKQATAILKKIQGIADLNDGLIAAGPSIEFVPDQDKLSLYNISLTDFQMQLAAYTGGVPLGMNSSVAEPSASQAALTGGIQIGELQDGQQMRKILLRFTNFKDNDLEHIKKQLIFLPNGQTRPLSFFCGVNVLPGEIEQTREDLKSNIILSARLDNRDLGSAISEIQQKLNGGLKLPKGYFISYGGAYSEQQQSFKELLLILGLAVVLVFAVLLFLFRDWLLACLVILISVLGIGGSILALFICNIPLNVSSYTGIIMIVGIIAENAIFTLNQFRFNLVDTGDVDTSINYAIALRIRPKLMTAIGAILALMPLALGIGLGAQMQQPLAVAVIGGFIAALPLLLFVFPSLIRLGYRKHMKTHKI
ncbi:efflux RND transporter permease subunit [Mucilaginibacter rubeus]|uniref:Efflux RND transporter permease subunit n=1 Tax=Mucilaginibacter rubeus TaxID=2027860 RepID=A0AAE6MKD9_9SPHI|nr:MULTISPECIES: efflux RND transporter permease subunit [Mucilaginibacter]QEM06620.1 efflux RND transporter permease subunit [Mucilaginibacter rubeus]QEM19209.1 efflux RND transporter permease subunit [Mucilaginibacter gossypii]QTE44247.1 efflux RND transporter permease subunit [Mucilaginibacter rubeus]QTE50847.1 efflux RND transporter permease subunit [Mucilaginibacter rubeus]QTE55929.1 efflux RND transporter permease subunit [Mucilaginibacter rubeus]